MYQNFGVLEKELRREVSGEVWFDEVKRSEYSTATCMYQVMPVGVVAPRTIEDVQAVVRVAARNDVAVIARGGATGLAGQALGFGIILDMSKFMNRILDISPASRSMTLQAGCIVHDAGEALNARGMFYPIDPQSAKHCTIGGTIATNAAGSHGLRYGSTKNQIRSLTVVHANGDVGVIQPSESDNRLTPKSLEQFSRVRKLLEGNQDTIRRHRPAVEKYSSGYNIFEAMDGNNLDATRLLCGSEGTLAVVVEARMSILPKPKAVLTAAAYFDSYEKTAEAVQRAREFSPSAIELLDKSYTEVGRGLSPTGDRFISRDFQAMLLLEFEGDEVGELQQSILKLHGSLARAHLITDWILVESPEERESLWMVREIVSDQFNRLPTKEKKISTIEDGAVPLPHLPEYMTSLKRILDRCGIRFTLYGHAGMGHVHCTTLVDLETPSGRERITEATEEVFDLITRLHGTLSAEHGDGFVRTPFLEKAFGREIYSIFKELKQTLDPQNILNPQKIVGAQDRHFLHDLKFS